MRVTACAKQRKPVRASHDVGRFFFFLYRCASTVHRRRGARRIITWARTVNMQPTSVSPISPVHENMRLHTRDRTRGAANRRGRREWHLEWNSTVDSTGRKVASNLGAVRPQKETDDPETRESLWDALRLVRLWARSGGRSAMRLTYMHDRTSICLPRAASGWLSGMDESTKSVWRRRRSKFDSASGAAQRCNAHYRSADSHVALERQFSDTVACSAEQRARSVSAAIVTCSAGCGVQLL